MAGCAIGVSDYGFSCVVHAATREEAQDWGITVAIEYAHKFGFPPHNIKPGDDEIVRNSSVSDCPNPEDVDHACAVGQFPESLN